MRIVTWNVNSIRAREARFLAWLESRQPDIVCLQELKVVDEKFPREATEALGYHVATHGQKTYNGVAIVSREPIEDVAIGLPGDESDTHARLIAGTTMGVRVFGAYFPNGGELGSDKWHYKLAWMKRLRAHLAAELDAGGPELALCGDYNVAPYDDDVARPHEWGAGVLCHPDARRGMQDLVDLGLVDVFRPFHPDGGVYTWWDYRGRGFERGNGLRIDHILCTPALAERCIGAAVDRDERTGESPSDHAPVTAEFD